MTKEIEQYLKDNQDLKYRDFHAKLVPNIEIEKIIGVRTPVLRSYAKILSKKADIGTFLNDMPHKYYDEVNLHGFIICEIKDYDATVSEIDRLLPYVDNWASCDLISPKAFKAKSNRGRLIKDVKRWIDSEEPYTRRFGIEMLMSHYLDEDFKPEYLGWVANSITEHYYVKMMVAWYFATALAKQYDAAVKYIEDGRLTAWVHSKTIQKAIESYRVSDERKAYLKTLRSKEKNNNKKDIK